MDEKDLQIFKTVFEKMMERPAYTHTECINSAIDAVKKTREELG